jgi:hypothetical protein
LRTAAAREIDMLFDELPNARCLPPSRADI